MPVAAGAAAIALLLGLLAGIAVIGGGGGLSQPFTTAWKAGRPFVASSGHTATRHGTWHLVDAVLTGTWQQNVYGPPPGLLSCSPDGTCYVLAGKYPSAMASAPLSETLYVSSDQGATWSTLPIPSGLAPTTPLECSGSQWCAAGGTYDGQPVLAVTRDGGHSFTVDPLPSGIGTLHALSCPSTGVCAGLVATGTPPTNATLLVTAGGGSTFRDEPILAGDSMFDLACTSSTDCTVVGTTDASMNAVEPTGVSAVTSNQGRTWTQGSLPTGFGLRSPLTSLACTDAQHCFVTGFIPIPTQNPPQCASAPSLPKPTSPAASTPPKMSPQVEAISKTETRLAAAAAAQEYSSTHSVGCTNAPFTQVGDVAASTDGGVTWTPEVLPADVPRPQLYGLACPTASDCWAAGQESVPQKIGKGTDLGSPVLIGTTNAGSTWSKVVFSVPSTAPNDTGQSYLTIGQVTCPVANVCVARGGAAQGSRYAPVYSLVAPGG
jgi:hypothetical protein